MSKLKQPFLSLAAFGTFAKTLTLRRRGRDTLIGATPHPVDARTSAQLAWRTMYQLATALWHALSPAEKAAWETLARPRHMTGYAWFMSQALRPNPGIYLPLAGGAMTGDIGMGSNRIANLPAPGAPNDPARQADLTAHQVDTTGIHGLGALHAAGFHTAGQAVSRIIWKDASQRALNDANRTVSQSWTDLDLTAYTSANAKIAILQLYFYAPNSGTAGASELRIRKNDTNPGWYPKLRIDNTKPNWQQRHVTALLGLDSGQVMEYYIIVAANATVNTQIQVLGYIE